MTATTSKSFNVPIVNRKHIRFRRAELRVAQGFHQLCMGDGVQSDIHDALNCVRQRSKDVEVAVLRDLRSFVMSSDTRECWLNHIEKRRDAFVANFVQTGASPQAVETYLSFFLPTARPQLEHPYFFSHASVFAYDTKAMLLVVFET